MKFTVITHIEAETEAQAQAVRDEMAQGAEDGRDSGEFPRSVVWNVGDLVDRVEDPASIIDAARVIYGRDNIEVDDDASATKVQNGFWVEARLWVGDYMMPEAAPEPMLAHHDISEGGHCD